ncbi:hypothetical protein SELMODRAFT_439046 [Selaginella moellendorffii]|uniref:Uncharacterized protein n=1 Tax=Selaginella moellendorffii TaxID=88036 RepID=D8R210_SELML|nr:hypothetical protein SELMODRAFT_439046 [Selaginella moellendorffii]
MARARYRGLRPILSSIRAPRAKAPLLIHSRSGHSGGGKPWQESVYVDRDPSPVRRLEHVLREHKICKAAPSWLPFVPGSCYWVPSKDLALLPGDAYGFVKSLGASEACDMSLWILMINPETLNVQGVVTFYLSAGNPQRFYHWMGGKSDRSSVMFRVKKSRVAIHSLSKKRWPGKTKKRSCNPVAVAQRHPTLPHHPPPSAAFAPSQSSNPPASLATQTVLRFASHPKARAWYWPPVLVLHNFVVLNPIATRQLLPLLDNPCVFTAIHRCRRDCQAWWVHGRKPDDYQFFTVSPGDVTTLKSFNVWNPKATLRTLATWTSLPLGFERQPLYTEAAAFADKNGFARKNMSLISCGGEDNSQFRNRKFGFVYLEKGRQWHEQYLSAPEKF